MPSVLITGASRGLGLEFARQYAADGWQVFAACRDPAAATELNRLAAGADGRFALVAMDVADGASVEGATARLGEAAIDVLVNNAGMFGRREQDVGTIDYESWARVLAVNVMGPLRVTQAFADQVARSGRRLIVTVSSGLGSLADNTSGGWIGYRSSKAAVNMVMRCAAIELAPRGIACVLLSPGWVRTDMGGANAPLTPAESVGAMRGLIDTFGPAHSGKFYHYDGSEYPW